MKKSVGLLLALWWVIAACASTKVPVTILADGRVYTVDTVERVPAKILSEAKVTLNAEDRILYLGWPTPADTPSAGCRRLYPDSTASGLADDPGPRWRKNHPERRSDRRGGAQGCRLHAV
jgi:hypothetical protein